MTPQELAERMKNELRKWVDEGTFPVTVGSWSEVHEHCDAMQVGDADQFWQEMTDKGWTQEQLCAFVDEAQGIVDQWLKNGGLR